MSRLQTVLFLLLFSHIIACAQSQITKSENPDKSIENWKTLNHEKYKINYPPSWDLKEDGQMGTSFILFSPSLNETDNFGENVNLLIQDLTGFNLNLDQYVELSEGQITTMIVDGDIILSERKNNDKGQYHKITYTGKQGFLDLKFEQFYWVLENKAYVLTLTCKEDKFDDYQRTGEEILHSFQIKQD